jgi:hypothetical protein
MTGNPSQPTIDEHVQSLMQWHFSEATGCPYWLQRRKTLGFDPLKDVRGFADLARFPDVADEWRETAATDLVPKGLAAGPVFVWETGGTTGAPRRIIEGGERYTGSVQSAVQDVLDSHGFPAPRKTGAPCGWLNVGPTGPHQTGKNRQTAAVNRGCLPYVIDLDPRWVKRLYREGRQDEASRYVAHVIDQTLDVLRTQPIQIMSATPPLIQAMCEHQEAYDLIRQKIKGIVWGGTSMSEETLRLLEEELLPGIPIVGTFGNSLASGNVWQRPRKPGDPFRCVFGVYVPAPPAYMLQLVALDDSTKEVAAGETGRVKFHILKREFFLPNHVERDAAVCVEPRAFGPNPSLSLVRPLEGARREVEGVY